MKTATVRELRNEFAKLEAWLRDGQTIDILRGGKPVARLVPATKQPRKFAPPDIMARLKKTWGDRVFSDEEVKAMRQAEQDHEGV